MEKRRPRVACTAGPAGRSPWPWAWPASSPRRFPECDWLIAYWYHFAIMFEALFILTTIDAGTRIARFLVQEFLGRVWKPLGNLDWLPASMLATGLVVFGWGYFIYTGSVETIWPMFGMANQLLAVIALAVVTTGLINAGRGRYAAVTLLPMLFVATTTSTTGYYEITGKFSRMIAAGEVARGWLNIGLTLMLLACVAVILADADELAAPARRLVACVGRHRSRRTLPISGSKGVDDQQCRVTAREYDLGGSMAKVRDVPVSD